MAESAANKALAPFVCLAERAGPELAKAGLRLLGFSIIPGFGGAPHHVRLVCILDEESRAADPDTDAALKGMLMATEEQERAARRDKERERLSELGDLLRDPNKGILGEED